MRRMRFMHYKDMEPASPSLPGHEFEIYVIYRGVRPHMLEFVLGFRNVGA